MVTGGIVRDASQVVKQMQAANVRHPGYNAMPHHSV
jgi:hypothetical protein